ncbi:hypothetical protein [Paenibacillus herberti]|uniref:Uncharacterized protein n=1 Tax=Paenibacillus herberti TaxID=1619309 RepID=A0A229P3L9_9BACL|nr:hypothetical protein [Paenibacillus herberti]OXM16842.1 hypothetical protein CGZ75_09375 [Paenibacillus herberti]
MNRFKQSLTSDKLQLFVSLPANDPVLAQAALAEGADGLKVHINVEHRASGMTFGSLVDNQDAISGIRSLYDGPLGIVPGGSIESVNQEEIEALPELGVDFTSIYAFHMPSFLLRFPKLARTFAIDSSFDPRFLEGAASFGVEALEASIIPGEEYGMPLSFADLLKYRWLVEHTKLPVIVPSQRKIVPADVPALINSGIRVLLIGAVVFGNDADGIRRAVAEMRNAIDRS